MQGVGLSGRIGVGPGWGRGGGKGLRWGERVEVGWAGIWLRWVWGTGWDGTRG